MMHWLILELKIRFNNYKRLEGMKNHTNLDNIY
jgi:hypothetical protein